MLASLIQTASLIIWDEALMTQSISNCWTEPCVIYCQVIILSRSTFGSKGVVLGDDLRQTLTVMNSQNVDAAVTNSPLWQPVEILNLTISMCLCVTTFGIALQQKVAAFSH